MAVDMFLKIEGIEGESTSKDHKGEIDVMSFSWGVSNSSHVGTGGGGGAGKSVPSDFSFQKRLDKASPSLALACATGQHIRLATLQSVRNTDKGNAFTFLVIKLTDLLVSSYSVSGGGDVPTDSFSLNFAKIEFDYTPNRGDMVGMEYDFVGNEAT